MRAFNYYRQHLTFGIEDEPIPIPHDLCLREASAIRYSIVAVPVNPRKQSLQSFVLQMPYLWGMGDSVFGRIIAANKVLFVFPNEELMNHILCQGPWSFAGWPITVNRWSPNMENDAWKFISLWIQIRGIPLPLLTRAIIGFIGSMLAPVTAMEFDSKTTQVEFVRIQVRWNIDKPLRFQRKYRFGEMETTVISYQYEGVRNFCVNCGMLSHDRDECPFQSHNSQETFPDSNDSEGGDNYGRYDGSDYYDLNQFEEESDEESDAIGPSHQEKVDHDLSVEALRYLYTNIMKHTVPEAGSAATGTGIVSSGINFTNKCEDGPTDSSLPM